jgi:glycosyltransferase involved in cell wall biosynthesis
VNPAAEQPLVSIVTPVYNGADYLRECIQSVLNQTYSNWDYTIIDNCSTDGTLEIAQQYAAKDPRIKVHRNSSLLRAIPNHNFALRQISPASKYCKVVFGDDWIFPGCIEEMVQLAEAHPSVGIIGAYALEGQRISWEGLEYPSHMVSGREICRRHLLEELYVFGSANAVLYRADLVRGRDPFYDESNIHADTDICFDLLKSNDFGFVHQVLTYTRVRPKSLSEMTNDLGTSFACMLRILVAHGRDYLTPKEYRIRLTKHLSEYYVFLGKSLMLNRKPDFWSYHKGALTQSGYGFSRARVNFGAMRAVATVALNPESTIRKLLSRRHREQSRDSFDPAETHSPELAAMTRKLAEDREGTHEEMRSTTV